MWTITSKVSMLVPALLTPVAIAEDVLSAVLPTLVPIVGPLTTVMAIEGGPDLATVDGRSTVGRLPSKRRPGIMAI